MGGSVIGRAAYGIGLWVRKGRTVLMEREWLMALSNRNMDGVMDWWTNKNSVALQYRESKILPQRPLLGFLALMTLLAADTGDISSRNFLIWPVAINYLPGGTTDDHVCG